MVEVKFELSDIKDQALPPDRDSLSLDVNGVSRHVGAALSPFRQNATGSLRTSRVIYS